VSEKEKEEFRAALARGGTPGYSEQKRCGTCDGAEWVFAVTPEQAKNREYSKYGSYKEPCPDCQPKVYSAADTLREALEAVTDTNKPCKSCGQRPDCPGFDPCSDCPPDRIFAHGVTLRGELEKEKLAHAKTVCKAMELTGENWRLREALEQARDRFNMLVNPLQAEYVIEKGWKIWSERGRDEVDRALEGKPKPIKEIKFHPEALKELENLELPEEADECSVIVGDSISSVIAQAADEEIADLQEEVQLLREVLAETKEFILTNEFNKALSLLHKVLPEKGENEPK
jgi:hypothetical protein